MCIMLVYDITNEKSFDNIKNWIRNIEEHASADVEKMILGNKCDMNDRRQVKPSVVYCFNDNLSRCTPVVNRITFILANTSCISRYLKNEAKS